MTTLADVIAIQLVLQNVHSVLDGLARVSTEVQTLDGQLRLLAGAGAAFVAIGLAIAGAAVAAYDGFARMRMGAETLLGTLEGDRFANALQQFSVPAAFDTGTLRRTGQFLLTSQGGDRTMEIMRSLTNLAAAGGASNASFDRIGYAIGQIASQGQVGGQEVRRQLLHAEGGAVVVKAIMDQLGLQNSRQLYGMDSQRFLDALIKAGQNEKFGGAQERLAQTSPVIALENMFQALLNALIPTGYIIAQVVYWFTKLMGVIIAVFGFLNKWTGGLLGLLIIIGLVAFGFQLLATWSAFMIGSFRGVMVAAHAAAIALMKVAGTSTAQNAGWLLTIWNFLKPLLLFILKLLAILALVYIVAWGMAKITEWVMEKLGIDIPQDKKFSDWLETNIGGPVQRAITGEEAPSEKKGTSADRPQRSSSWERVYHRRFGNAMGG